MEIGSGILIGDREDKKTGSIQHRQGFSKEIEFHLNIFVTEAVQKKLPELLLDIYR